MSLTVTTLRHSHVPDTKNPHVRVIQRCPSVRSLYNRRVISQARRTRHFARGARPGAKKKYSACNQSFVLALPPTYAHKYWLTAVISKGPIKTRSITRKIVTFLAVRNIHSSINHRTWITFNNVKLSAAKIRFAQSKFSLCFNTAARRKRGKTCCLNKFLNDNCFFFFLISKHNLCGIITLN